MYFTLIFPKGMLTVVNLYGYLAGPTTDFRPTKI